MKNEKSKGAKIACLSLLIGCMFIFAGCSDLFNSPEGQNSETGSLSLIINGTNSRTILPDLGSFDSSGIAVYYTLTITPAIGGEPRIVDRNHQDFSDPIKLPAGFYNVEVKAYRDANRNQLVAQGSVNAVQIFDKNGITRSITLSPLIASGKGTFAWDIGFSGLSLDLLSLKEARIQISRVGNAGGDDAPGGGSSSLIYYLGGIENGQHAKDMADSVELDSGYYRVLFIFAMDGAQRIEWREVLHVYQNLTSAFSHTFTQDHINNIKYTVTYVYNDGTGTHNIVQDKQHGDTVTPPPPAVREGYVFAGWFTDDKFTTPFNAGTQLISSITLYAKWTESGDGPAPVIVGDWYWGTFNDAGNGGTSTITMIENNGVLNFTGTVTDDTEWGGFVGIFANPINDETLAKLRMAESISFKVRGDGKTYRIILPTNDIGDYSYYSKSFTATTKEETITIKISDLEAPEWGEGMTTPFNQANADNIQWQIDEPGAFSITISDLTLHGYPPDIAGNLGNYTFGLEEDNVSLNHQLALWSLPNYLLTVAKTDGAKLVLELSTAPSASMLLVWQGPANDLWWQAKDILDDSGAVISGTGVEWNASTKTLSIDLSTALADYRTFTEQPFINLAVAYFNGNSINDLGMKSANLFDGSGGSGEYTITVKPVTGGTITTNPSGTAVAGTRVAITVSPNQGGWYLADLSIEDSYGKYVSVHESNNGAYYFFMPDSAVTISPTFGQSGTGQRYNITVGSATNGEIITIPRGSATAGTTVTIYAYSSDKDWYLADLSIYANNVTGGGKIDQQKNNTGGFTFTMPASDVTITATFEEEGGGGTSQGSFTISFEQISDVAKELIVDQKISRTEAGGLPKTVELSVDADLYTSITWNITGTGVTGSGATFILDATDMAYNAIGQHFLTLFVVSKDGKPYNKTIIFTVVE